jgi:hypothetical protein
LDSFYFEAANLVAESGPPTDFPHIISIFMTSTLAILHRDGTGFTNPRIRSGLNEISTASVDEYEPVLAILTTAAKQ